MVKIVACGIFFICLFGVCISDIKYRKIPNELLLIILGCGLLCFNYYNYIFSLIVFIVGFSSYYLKKLGAGDVKLIFILSLFVNSGDELIFTSFFSLSVFSFLILFFVFSKLMSGVYWDTVRNLSPIKIPSINSNFLRKLPFGIPISISFSIYYYMCIK